MLLCFHKFELDVSLDGWYECARKRKIGMNHGREFPKNRGIESLPQEGAELDARDGAQCICSRQDSERTQKPSRRIAGMKS